MYIFPFTVIDKVARESRSGMADAPTVPYEPPRHRLRAVRRLLRAEEAPEPAAARPTLTLLPGAGRELCEAEVRDRGTTAASAARAC
ncbi:MULTISPECIES: hypothetical protein [unclassified Kribbella]|uniref:hypothetical protein n=1 Tax=unclassified Kribbella TaxID=2644121 RepID=UPI003077DEE0